MEVKFNKIKTCNNLERKKPKDKRKLFEYQLRRLTGVNFIDFSTILGCENALKIFINYGGTTIYIPKITTLQKNINNLWIRYKYKYYYDMGADKISIYRQLSIDLRVTIQGIKHILGKLYKDGDDYSEIYKMKTKDDERLLNIIKDNFSIFVESGLIKGQIKHDFENIILIEEKEK